MFTKVRDEDAEGARLTVVMLHGVASDAGTFEKALTYWKEALPEVRWVAFDLPGAGKAAAGEKYDYDEYMRGLERALAELKLATPLVLVGHSMGALIAARYAAMHPEEVRELILLSPPVYTERDLDSSAMAVAIKAFRDAVSLTVPEAVESEAFQKSMENIVLARDNYQTLATLKVPTTLIYGDVDQFIAVFNLPKVVRENPEYLTLVRTPGHHGVSRAKYEAAAKVVRRMLAENT